MSMSSFYLFLIIEVFFFNFKTYVVGLGKISGEEVFSDSIQFTIA